MSAWQPAALCTTSPGGRKCLDLLLPSARGCDARPLSRRPTRRTGPLGPGRWVLGPCISTGEHGNVTPAVRGLSPCVLTWRTDEDHCRVRDPSTLVRHRRLAGADRRRAGHRRRAGGAAYKDTFSLPHTETASVAKLLKNAGLDNRTAPAARWSSRTGRATGSPGAPPTLEPALAKVCASGNHVALISTPWQSIDCTNPGAARRRQPASCSTPRGAANTALVTIIVGEQPLRPDAVHERLRRAQVAAQQLRCRSSSPATPSPASGRATARAARCSSASWPH